ncbi:BnaCnng11110D [Brassica napus]|uniref:BnaCnng11110D protein n=2 Tax=Brassica napus TaxID=3708 RepID=A0A078I5P5_BRANA|nr:BnaCnng11110D [Brassica napus]
MDYFQILELPEEIHALVVERVAGNSFQDLYGLRASCKLMKALADRRSVCHFYDVLSVPCGLNMPAELLKTYKTERNPSTLYMKGVQFFFTFNLQEERRAYMKLAADERYERAVYTYAMTRKCFWGDEECFARFTRESVDRIGKLV